MEEYLKKYQIDFKSLKTIEEISSKPSGVVYLVENQNTNEKFATKIINSETEQNKTIIEQNIGTMIRMNHPTIIKFYGYSLTDFNGKNNVTLLLQYAKSGSLADLLKKLRSGLLDHPYDNTTRQKILVGVARGMMYLHERNVIHNNFNPDNILLDDNLEPYITDFVSSKFKASEQSDSQIQSKAASIYTAPEIYEGGKCSGKSNVYSFGIIMFEVITSTIPYKDFQNGKLSDSQFISKVVTEDYRPQFYVPVKKSIQSLIEKCWSKDPHNRPTFSEIFNRLAFNIEQSVYDIYSKKDEIPDYYLPDVDQNCLLFYTDSINDDQIQFKKLNDQIITLQNECEKIPELESTIEDQSDEIHTLKRRIRKLKKKLKIDPDESESSSSLNYSSSDSDEEVDLDKMNRIEIPYIEGKEFNGIVKYIINHSTNIFNEINITSSSMMREDNSALKLIQYDDKDSFFESANFENSWFCFDFKKRRVLIKYYTIRSANEKTGPDHLSDWYLEGSDDNENWEYIDHRRRCEYLKGPYLYHTFMVIIPDVKICRYVRLRQVGRNSRGYSYFLKLNCIEFYGVLLE